MALRWVYPPYPVGFMSRKVIEEYVQGYSPVTGKKLMPEIVEALTIPLAEEEKHPVLEKKPRHPRLLGADTERNLHRMFLENAWTDGLPIVLPTEERVQEMLTGTDAAPDEVVGRMSVTTHEERLEYTVEKVAVVAVMAGARPEHLPVILALASSCEPAFPSSTSSWGRMAIVNGPIRSQIGMNSTAGAFSPFNYANAVIGRAYTLMTINFGDAKIAKNFTATYGHTSNYNNMLAAENEESSPWTPFHTSKGFKAEESAVSLFRGWMTSPMNAGGADAILRKLKTPGNMGSTLVMDPLVAKQIVDESGFKTREEFTGWLHDQLKNSMKDSPMARFMTPDRFSVIVIGGEWNPLWIHSDMSYTRTLSIDKWIPKNGVKMDEKPLRMPVAELCADGSCGI